MNKTVRKSIEISIGTSLINYAVTFRALIASERSFTVEKKEY